MKAPLHQVVLRIKVKSKVMYDLLKQLGYKPEKILDVFERDGYLYVVFLNEETMKEEEVSSDVELVKSIEDSIDEDMSDDEMLDFYLELLEDL